MKKKTNKLNFNKKLKNVVASILALFALMAVVSGILAIFDFSLTDWFKDAVNDVIKEEPKHTLVYLVPNEEWSEDNSNYGAWCWNDSGDPAAAFILAADEDEDGVFEFILHLKQV